MEHRIVGSAPGSPAGRDLFEPHMPGVDVLEDMDALFARAREQSAGGPVGERSVVVVTPGRMLMAIPAERPPGVPDEAVQGLRAFLDSDRPLTIAVVAYTKLEAIMDEGKAKAIPFLGHLIGFGYLGNRVVVFEGHPTAFEAGVRGADLLLIDSGMLPFLQEDWAHVAFRVMAEGARVFVHDRERYSLLPAVRSSTPEGWRYGEPDGEASYVNCLLTTLAQSGKKSVQILAGAPLPDLARIATDPGELEWIAGLPFRYSRLNAEQVISILAGAAKERKTGLFSRELILSVRLATGEGEPRPVAFRLTPSRTAGGRQMLQVERV